MAKYGRNYADQKEYNMRLEIFTKNAMFVESHDAEGEGFTVAINKFSDWTEEEFGRISGKYN